MSCKESEKKMRDVKKGLMNAVYLFFWIAPLFLFGRDFWVWEDIQGSMDSNLWKIILFTWKQSLYSSFFAFFVAILPARYLAYHKNGLSKVLDSLSFIPFFFPVISTIGIFSILWNLPYLKEFSILYSMKAIILAHVFYNSPIFVKYIGEALRRVPKELEEAFYLDGAGAWIIFWRGQLPIIFPQVFKAFILCFSYCFLSFAIILSLGGVQNQTLEVEIYSTLVGNFNFSKAMLYGILQFLMLFLVNSFSSLFRNYELKGEAYEKKSSLFSFFFSFVYVLFEYGIVLASVFASFYNYFIGEFTLKGYLKIFNQEFQGHYPVWEAFRNSIMVSLFASLFTVLVAYFLLRYYSHIVEMVIFANLGITGAFYAMTLYYVYVLFDIPMYILLSFAYVMLGVPLAYSFLYQNVKSFPKNLDEMAYLDGARPWQRFWRVRFPILSPLFVSTFLQLFAIFLGEFTLAFTMQIGDLFPVVSLVNYSLLIDKKYLESSALSAILLFFILLLFLLGEWMKSKGEKER